MSHIQKFAKYVFEFLVSWNWKTDSDQREEQENLMPIRDAAEAAIEGGYGEEAEDSRGQDLRAQEQE